MERTLAERNKQLALKAFDTLFNRHDYDAAATMWSEGYIQHSTHIGPGRQGLFERVRSLPVTFRYDNALAVADGDYVVLYGRFSGHGQPRPMIVANILRIDDGRLAERLDVIQDEATAAKSKSGLPNSLVANARRSPPPKSLPSARSAGSTYCSTTPRWRTTGSKTSAMTSGVAIGGKRWTWCSSSMAV